QPGGGIDSCFHRYKSHNSLALQFVGSANDRRHRDSRVADKRAFYFRCAKSVASHIQNIVNPPNDPEIAVIVAACAVSGQIIALEFAPVLLPVTSFVAVNRTQHRRPGRPTINLPTTFGPALRPFSFKTAGLTPKNGRLPLPCFVGIWP